MTKYRTILTKEDLGEPVSGITNCRLLKVMESLLWGIPVKLGGYTLALFESKDSGYVPVILVKDHDNPEDFLVQGAPELSIQVLSEMATKMTEQEFEILSVQLAASKTITLNNKHFKK